MAGAANWLILLLTHPIEFKTLLQFYLYHEQKRDIKAIKEHPTSGWDRESMRRCWGFLDLTSRSFAAVIKELEGDLARTICLFYLVLRGLDTVEDDMTIPDDVKQPILRNFHNHTVTPGWNFDGCGPNEKDRQLLVEYDVVVEEVNRLAPQYRTVIVDICHKMQTGMADYAHNAATTGHIYLTHIADYDLYCHYVAGLVGEGLSRIFSASQLEAPWVGEQLELSNSMGLLLQKTNIIRDYREDTDEKRYFWPKEIWGKYGFSEMKEMYEEGNEERAMWVQSNMVVDALRHAVDALDYLRFLKNQTVFNFCAIPATMAIATLELCFMNPAMFQRNIKIRKADAAGLIMRSTNPRSVGLIFRTYARKIHAKSLPSDPNYLKLSVSCARIEQWYQHNYPSFVQIVEGAEGGVKVEIDESDARARIMKVDEERERGMKRRAGEREKGGNGVNGVPAAPTAPAPAPTGANNYTETSVQETLTYLLAAVGVLVVFCSISVYLILYFFDEPDTGSFRVPDLREVVGRVVEMASFGLIKAQA